MVKLVRLTSNDNCKFNADLDAGIDVAENTQIAVQNITAQTVFPTLNITHDNRIVRSNLDTDAFSHITSHLEIKQYTSANHTDFFKDLEQTLNDTMRTSGKAGQTTIDDGGDVFRAIRVDYPNRTPESADKVELEMRVTPVTMPFLMNDPIEERELEEQLFFKTADVNVDDDPGGAAARNPDFGNMWQDGAATANRTNYISPIIDDSFLSRGSGIWGCRVQNLIDNGGASNTNGWAIGLSWTRTASGTDAIANTSRDFEIRVKKPTDNYEYITPANAYTEVGTGLAPYSMVTISPNGGTENDQMVFWKNGTKLHMQIWNRNGAANGQVAWEHIYTLTKAEAQKPLYPYIYMCGNSSTGGATQATDNIIGQPFYTPDPFITNNEDFEVTGAVQDLGGEVDNNLFDILGTDMSAVIPDLQNAVFKNVTLMDVYEWRMDAEVWDRLGFYTGGITEGHYDYKPIPNMHPTSSGNLSQQLRILLIARDIYTLVLSDNFIVVLDSNPVMSYDASRFDYGSSITAPASSNIHRGRRQNILATIPVNDNNGILEYRANELVYIDLDNKYPQTLKNLRLRVLNKNFDEITTTGISVMTLLIKG